MKGTLIVFGVKRSRKGMSPASYSRFYRKLYGYNNSSNYGTYHSRVPGFLDEMRHIKYANGVIVIAEENSRKVIRFLKSNKAKVFSWTVELSEEEANLLGKKNTNSTD